MCNNVNVEIDVVRQKLIQVENFARRDQIFGQSKMSEIEAHWSGVTFNLRFSSFCVCVHFIFMKNLPKFHDY